MNDDHETALLDMCAAASPDLVRPEGAKIVALDRAGCLVETRAPDGAALPRLRRRRSTPPTRARCSSS